MRHLWQVNVRDADGNPVTDATVAMRPTSELAAAGLEYPFAGVEGTHAHEGDGRYVATELAATDGPLLLLVQREGMSPVVQPLALRRNASGEVLGSMPLTSLAKTVTFAAETVATPEGKQRTARFTVTLFPAAEVVFLSGTEYNSAGTQFHLFALGRRDALFREKKVDDGTLVTLVSCDHRGIGSYVKAHRGFLAVRPLPTPPRTPGRAHVAHKPNELRSEFCERLAAEGVLSVTAFYKYLSSVGAQRPGTVKEASIFSHSWGGGPILYNSYQVLPGQRDDEESPPTPKRFKLDFDGRAKDFLRENVEGDDGWPHMKAAFTKDAVFRLWGCNAEARYRKIMADAKANENRPPDELFVTTYVNGRKPRFRDERAMSGKAAVVGAYKLFTGPEVYLAAAGKHLGITTFGAAPGVGSEFRFARGIASMRVVTTDWGATYPYLKKQFSPELEPTSEPFDEGFVSYSKVASRTPPPEPELDSGAYRLVTSFDHGPGEAPAWLRFDCGVVVELDEVGYRLRSEAATVGGKTGHRFILRHPKKTRAYLATREGEVFELHASAKERFDVLGPALP